MDFLLMPPPNMQMNTPFVLAGERMSGGLARPSNATPSLVARSNWMDVDFTDTVWNANANRNATDTSTSERVVFRTNRVNLPRGHADDDRLEDIESDDNYVGDEDDESNRGQNKFTGNFIGEPMRKQEPNTASNTLMNNRPSTLDSGASNQQPIGPAHSGSFFC